MNKPLSELNPIELRERLLKLGLHEQAKALGTLPSKCECELHRFITVSPELTKLKSLVVQLSLGSCNDPVMIYGETGTGKEIIARALHGERTGQFVAVNCTSLPDYLLESELFGHKRGSFTGAEVDKVGLFEYANGGTIFLDEIGDMPLVLQSKILRALQEKKIRRVGDNVERAINPRIVAATWRPLDRYILEDVGDSRPRFRTDLYWRIARHELRIPPLRERVQDIHEIIDALFDPEGLLTVEERERIAAMPLHGNVRELEARCARLTFNRNVTTKSNAGT